MAYKLQKPNHTEKTHIFLGLRVKVEIYAKVNIIDTTIVTTKKKIIEEIFSINRGKQIFVKFARILGNNRYSVF